MEETRCLSAHSVSLHSSTDEENATHTHDANRHTASHVLLGKAERRRREEKQQEKTTKIHSSKTKTSNPRESSQHVVIACRSERQNVVCVAGSAGGKMEWSVLEWF